MAKLYHVGEKEIVRRIRSEERAKAIKEDGVKIKAVTDAKILKQHGFTPEKKK